MNGRRRLTRKPPLFLLSPRGRWERGAWVGLCYGESDIATLAEGIQVLYAAQEGGRRGVDGRGFLSPAPAERVHRVAKRSGGHGEVKSKLVEPCKPQQATQRYAGPGSCRRPLPSSGYSCLVSIQDVAWGAVVGGHGDGPQQRFVRFGATATTATTDRRISCR